MISIGNTTEIGRKPDGNSTETGRKPEGNLKNPEGNMTGT